MKKILVFVFMLSVTIAFSELKLQWRFKVGDIVNSCPAIADDGTVYFGSWDGNLYALTNDGKVKWAYNVGNIINTSVAIGEDGTIYFGSDDGYLYALSPNKELKWKFKTTRAISATPAIGIDGTIYIGGNDKYFYAINPNGSLKWKIELGGKISASAVIDSEGIIYIGSEDGSLYAITEEGQIIWTFQAKGSITNSVAIDKAGIIYLGDRRGNVYAIDREGKVIWTSMIGGTILSGIIIDEEGNLYFTTSDARIRSLNKKGEERWVINFSRNTSTTGIILKNGKIYFTIDEKIVGITKEGKVIEEYNIGERTGMGINYWKDTIYVGSFDSSVYAIKTEASEQGGQYSKFGVNSKNQGDLMEKDNQNPIVMITNIEQGELVEEGERVIKIKYEDNQRVKYIEIYEDNKEIKKEVINKKEGEYEFTWNTGEAGKKEIKVIAYDIAGNKGEARVLIRVEKVKKNEAPGKPRNISPKEGEVIEKQTVVLEWESEDPEGDELRYDIYFGLDSDPPLIMSGYTGNRYEVVNLETGKTYYWKIVAKDDKGGISESSIWNFKIKTPNRAPVISKDGVIKSDYSTSRTSVKLEWESEDPDGDELSYDIYFGLDSNPPLIMSGYREKRYEVKNLETGKTYYWKIVANDNNGGIIESPVWKFTFYPVGSEKWKFNTNGIIKSAPALGKDGTVYVASTNYLYAIRQDGTLKWMSQTNGQISSSPAIGLDGTIYVGTESGYIFAFYQNGSVKWTYRIAGWVYRTIKISSPAISLDNTIYVGVGYTVNNRNYGYIYAINQNGTYKWSFQTTGLVESSPAIDKNGTIYIGSDDGFIYAINPDGKLKWKFQAGGWVLSSPAVDEYGTVYVGCGDNYLYAINSNGTLKWKFKTEWYIRSSPVIGNDGVVYFGSYDKYLYAVNPNGTLRWRFQTSSYIESTPAIGSDEMIYFGSNDGYIYAINPNGTLRWRYKTGKEVYSSPTIGLDGTLYIGSSDNYLYAIQTTSYGLANSSWPKFRKDLQNTGNTANITVLDTKETSIISAPNIQTQTISTEQTKTEEQSGKTAYGIGYGLIGGGGNGHSYFYAEGYTVFFGKLDFAAFSGWRILIGKNELNVSYVSYFDFIISLGIGAGFSFTIGPYLTYMVGVGLPIPNSFIIGAHAWFLMPLLKSNWTGGTADISIIWSF